jgi:molybdate transport system ATP-binding protein
MDILPEELQFISKEQTWALTGDSNSGHSTLLQSALGKHSELVSYRHHFRNLSNTTDFYYQQRYNSMDAEDALTVRQYLSAEETTQNTAYWNKEKVIEHLHLEQLLDETLIKLSNGETRRLLIAAALIKNPKLLLLDHPLTGLDVKTRQQFSNLLELIVKSGINVILATDPWEIPSAITHVAVLQNGKIISQLPAKTFQPGNFNFVQPPPVDIATLKALVNSHPFQEFQTILDMKNIKVEYDGRKILDGINWHIAQGDRWSLSGPNGAGKSTLLSLINGDNPQAYANDIIIFDRQRGTGESIWDIKRQTGFVSPELYQYFPTDSSCMHVIESGFYDTIGLFRSTDPDKEAVCLRWMKLLHLDQYAHKLFSMVPSSAQRLCLLARALVKNPALLILDEPTQGLDASQQQFFTRLIDDICAISNVTVIYVTHYEHHIPKAVSKYLRLDKGRMV